ncbi:hypothetical protein DPMN_006904 [Dreissena polymorpha]|uniref:Uncharacterized protein n=1 Tax=Dreissena polymorpha TaxID=45954 RepID=A0A9D4MXF2_DREPO|nr:hypothetical protein DPMN_006904 [Dreissena polymorpha]
MIMKLHRYIDHDWKMTPIDFQVFRRKKLVIRLANAGGLAGWRAGWLAGWRNKLRVPHAGFLFVMAESATAWQRVLQ